MSQGNVIGYDQCQQEDKTRMELLQKKTPTVTTDKARFKFCKISSFYSYFIHIHR